MRREGVPFRGVVMIEARCRPGFATPTETFEGFNPFQNVSDRAANPVTLQAGIRLFERKRVERFRHTRTGCRKRHHALRLGGLIPAYAYCFI